MAIAGADVEHAADVAVERRERRPRDVADVDVVAALRAVAEDPARLALEQPAEEDRDDAGLAVGILARPVDVAEAQRDVRRPVEPRERAEVALAGELRGAVRRERQARIVLARRPLALAVDRAARRREDDAGARRARAASSTFTVPTTLTAASNAGSATETRTSACAARCTIASRARLARRSRRAARGCRARAASRRRARSRACPSRGRRRRAPRRRARAAPRRRASR